MSIYDMGKNKDVQSWNNIGCRGTNWCPMCGSFGYSWKREYCKNRLLEGKNVIGMVAAMGTDDQIKAVIVELERTASELREHIGEL